MRPHGFVQELQDRALLQRQTLYGSLDPLHEAKLSALRLHVVKLAAGQRFSCANFRCYR
jgi:hypothetical protein